MTRKKISVQTRGEVILPPNDKHDDEIEDMVRKLIGARQALNLSFALWSAWRKSEVPSNSDIHSQVTVMLSECLEMANHLTSTLDQLRILTYGSKDLSSTMKTTEQVRKDLKQLPLWDDV